MTNKSGDRIGMFDSPWAQAFGGFLDDGRGACKDIGINIIEPQIKIDAVTFSFFLLLIFNVSKHPIT